MNLYIIRTTFQAFLAEKIIAERKDFDSFILYIAANAKKNQYNAFERLELLSRECRFIILPDTSAKLPNLINHLRVLKQISRFKTKFENIFISSIDSIIIQTILSKVDFINLFTFDDGTANYNKEGVYFNAKKTSRLKYISLLFGNIYTMERIKKESKAHYAILPNENNIVTNIIPLKFNINIPQNVIIEHTSCNVLLGGIFDTISSDSAALLKDISEKMNFIDYYIPHPRETKINIFKSKKFQQEHVAEILIEELLLRYSKVIVYAFNSTSVLTLSKYQRVELHLLSHKTIKKNYLFYFLSNYAQLYEI